MEALHWISPLLENYWVRTQVFRVVQFSSAMLSGVLEGPRPQCAGKLMRLSAAVSNMRIMLRLLDDLPVLTYTLTSWKQLQGESVMERCGELVNAISSQLYYPVEHLAWAADQQLVTLPSAHVWTLAIMLWGLSILFTLLRKLKQLVRLKQQLHVHATNTQSKSNSDSLKLQCQRSGLVMDIAQNVCDLILAVFWMPPGFLWAGKLPPTWWGLLGTISSLIGLYKICK